MKSFIATVATMAMLMVSASAENWATYPSVPKTATYNGFADMVLSNWPLCAQECVKMSTGNTPCPYWDTGCLCIMPQWSGSVALCIAANCTGENVEYATLVALSVCSSVGANMWLMPGYASTSLEDAAAESGELILATTVEASSPSTSSDESESITSSSSSGTVTASTASSSANSTTSGSSTSASSTSSGEGVLLSGGVQAALWAVVVQVVMAIAVM